ncbi:ABC transporter ATP-binding protein [Oscillibacter sp.]|uniref:ABC transporter ATP-binding protein n=1 Tax=Oscillibacter sp. TaxID=1945593 RepID=UPI0028B0A157|nr:ABC transporter ATP-binding protein [Oscillibacter sp.]
MNKILEVQGGCFSYAQSKLLLHDITFSLDRGQVMAVMGRNGIGKTTLIKCIVGILNWNSGYSAIDGKRSQKNKPMKEIGYVPQAHRVSFNYSVRDMVVFGKTGHSSFFATPSPKDYALADQMLERIGIHNLRDHPCNELSGGQLQLVYIARALINSPQLLVLDEQDYITGHTEQVMTDANIQKFFGVYSHSVEFQYKGNKITSFSFLDEV